ncbi:PI-PLC domain-containing protein [Streptomyces sp. E2N171]|uniref:PI-PLC domain-containing protein n=1 Tax=Streptomyces sp. E2N171 TaxID=1851914 RepID=UPI0031BAA551
MAQQHPDPADVLARHLRARATEFLRALRLHRGAATPEDSAEAARALRRAARRISAGLYTFRPALDPSWSRALGPELAWVSGTLSQEDACTTRLARLLEALHHLSGAPVPPTPSARPPARRTPAPAGATHPAPLSVGSGAGDLAAWYLTPADAPGGPMPPKERRTLDQVTFLTAHNAYANGVDGGFAPPFVDLFPNQSRGIEQQLRDGVRGFMLDVHQTPDGAILCHNSCTLVRRPVALWVDLQRITDFLHAHPDEFVTVFLEDYVDPGVLRAELDRVQGLSDVLYRPDRTGVREHGWPTLGELAADGHRLLIFTDHSKDADRSAGLTRDTFGVMYQRDWTVENHWSMGPGIGSSDWSCYSRWYDANTTIPLTRTEPGFRPLFVMNHFRDAAVASTATTDNAKLADRARRFCLPAARKKPTYLAVDRYDLGNPTAAVDALNTYTYP